MKRLSNKEFVKELMKDLEFKAEYNALEPEFELLEKILTKTSAVGRLETGGNKAYSKNHKINAK